MFKDDIISWFHLSCFSRDLRHPYQDLTTELSVLTPD